MRIINNPTDSRRNLRAGATQTLEESIMKNFFFVMLVFISIAVIAACSRGYENQINAAGLNITLKADRYPLVKDDSNHLAFIIVGSAQRTITDAKVEARLYKANAAGMPPVNSKTEAVLNGDMYFFTVTPDVEGAWKVDLTVTRQERQAVTTTFTMDVR
jgi:hypothetical protein